MIVITGILGSGKSTLGKMLSQKHGYFFVDELVLDFDFPYDIKKEASEGSEFAVRKIDQWFLDCDNKREIGADEMRRSKTVVMEGNHMTTLAYSYANDNASYERLFSIYNKDKSRFIEPDAYIILKINSEASIRRQIGRGDISHPLWEDRKFNWNNKDFVKRYYNFLCNETQKIENSKILEVYTADDIGKSFKDLEVALALI